MASTDSQRRPVAPRADGPRGVCRYCGQATRRNARRCDPSCNERTSWRELHVPKVARLAVFARDEYTCRSCNAGPLPATQLEDDHFVRLVDLATLGLPDTLENHQTLCIPCHDEKTRGEAVTDAATRRRPAPPTETPTVTPPASVAVRRLVGMALPCAAVTGVSWQMQYESGVNLGLTATAVLAGAAGAMQTARTVKLRRAEQARAAWAVVARITGDRPDTMRARFAIRSRSGFTPIDVEVHPANPTVVGDLTKRAELARAWAIFTDHDDERVEVAPRKGGRLRIRVIRELPDDEDLPPAPPPEPEVDHAALERQAQQEVDLTQAMAAVIDEASTVTITLLWEDGAPRAFSLTYPPRATVQADEARVRLYETIRRLHPPRGDWTVRWESRHRRYDLEDAVPSGQKALPAAPAVPAPVAPSPAPSAAPAAHLAVEPAPAGADTALTPAADADTKAILLPPPTVPIPAAFEQMALPALTADQLQVRENLEHSLRPLIEQHARVQVTRWSDEGQPIRFEITYHPQAAHKASRARGRLLETVEETLPAPELWGWFVTWDSAAFRMVFELHLDALARTLPLPPLPAAEDIDLGRVPLGSREDGSPFDLPLVTADGVQHLLVVGTSGSGKAGPLWLVIRYLAPLIQRGLVRLWLIDPKGGMEFHPAADLAGGRFAVTKRERAALLTRFKKELNDKAEALAARGMRKLVTPTVEFPIDVLIVDEVLSLVRDGQTVEIDEALQVGRAVGCVVLAASQKPQVENLPFRDMFLRVLALRLAQKHHVKMVLGDGAREMGAICDKIPKELPGVGYESVDGGVGVVRFRGFFFTDAERARICTEYAPRQRAAQEALPVVEPEHVYITAASVQVDDVIMWADIDEPVTVTAIEETPDGVQVDYRYADEAGDDATRTTDMLADDSVLLVRRP